MKKLLLSLSILTFASSAFAGVFPTTLIPGSSQAYTSNRGYVGLKWAFTQGFKPEAVIGFRTARIQPSTNTQGGDISMSAKFIDGFELGKLRVKYFDGIPSAQAEVSGGYDFKKGIFAGLGVNAPFINAGVDYLIMDKVSPFEPYVMLDSLKKYKKANSSGPHQGCPNGPGINPNSGYPCASY